MTTPVGIDFGTSNSGVAYYQNGRVHLLPIDGKNIVPEVVKTILYITAEHRMHIGQDAVEMYYKQNINRMRRFEKRWVGEVEYHGSDSMYYVTDVYSMVDILQPGRLLQFLKTALRTKGFEGTLVFDRYYPVGELVSIYIRLLKERSEALLGTQIDSVTLGRPVHFSQDPALDQKAEDTLAEAAREAGFRKVHFELEPIAAALNYGQQLTSPQNVVIFDFGGGTLDITVMRLGDTRQEVFANGGIDVAGSDFDRAIIRKQMLKHFGKGRVDHLHEISELVNAVPDWMALPELSTPKARVRLETAIQQGHAPARLKALLSLIFNDLAFSFYNAVESAKIALSSQGAAVIHLREKDLHVWELYTRSQFERDIHEYERQVEEVVLQTVGQSGLEPEQIDAVVTTGGSSNIPLFSNLLAGLFGQKKIHNSNAFSSVVAGLSMRAAEHR